MQVVPSIQPLSFLTNPSSTRHSFLSLFSLSKRSLSFDAFVHSRQWIWAEVPHFLVESCHVFTTDHSKGT